MLDFCYYPQQASLPLVLPGHSGEFYNPHENSLDRARCSTTLFDLVAVYMAFSEKLLTMEELPVQVTGDGTTVINSSKRSVRCDIDWNDLTAFEDLIVQQITS